MLSTQAEGPSQYPSYNRWYWVGWGVCSLVLLLVSGGIPTESELGVFALITGFAAVCVFHLEFGRFQGFVESNFPDRWQSLASTRGFEALAFFHPRLLRELFGDARGLPETYRAARGIFRVAYMFCCVTLACVLAVGWHLATARVPSFSSLDEEDVVDVRYFAKGDVGVSIYDFSFRGGATRAVEVRWTSYGPGGAEANLATLNLTKSDLDGLDKRIGNYRSVSSGCWGSVTVSTEIFITITHQRAGRVITTERFKLTNCTEHKVKGVLSFPELVERAGGYKRGGGGHKKSVGST